MKYKLELLDLSKEVTTELLRYIYTDHIDNSDNLSQLLSLSLRFKLQGMLNFYHSFSISENFK